MSLATHCIPYDEDCSVCNPAAAPPSLDALKSTEKSSSTPIRDDQEGAASPLINDKHREPASGQLVAGRQLDALIAEKVMGEPYPASITDYPWWSSAPVMSPREQWVASVHPDGSDPARHIWVPRYYSTFIADGWLVVEKMRERGADLDLFVHSHLPNPWTARFPNGPDNPASHDNVTAETAPLAICLAALKVVGA